MSWRYLNHLKVYLNQLIWSKEKYTAEKSQDVEVRGNIRNSRLRKLEIAQCSIYLISSWIERIFGGSPTLNCIRIFRRFCLLYTQHSDSWIGNSRAKKLFQNSIGKIFVSSLATSWSKNHYLFIQSSHELSSMNNNAHAMCTIKQRFFFMPVKLLFFVLHFLCCLF